MLLGPHSESGSAVPHPSHPPHVDAVAAIETLADAAGAPGALLCEIRPDRDVVVIAPQGELDISTAPILDAQLSDLCDVGFDKLILDLRGLEFLDSTGVHLLIRWTAWAGAREDGFRLIAGGRPVAKVLELTGIVRQLRFVDPRLAP
ncbi:MAG: anti-sigma factor antagonist [Solirubrobacteraceae bacterium]|nr:anti-sigma factor antagonist [Solirubrobacteraceae bacterium]MEA2319112.1 anti-sigma factor antagonist [Solirubrobacteraceae bacterium]